MIRRSLLTPWPFWLWTLLIFILLSVDTGSMEHVPMFGLRHLDKLLHFFLFGTMAFLWVYRTRNVNRYMLAFIFLVVALYGTGMEFFQEHFTSREFEWEDAYADTLGALAGTITGKKIGPYGNRGRNQN